MNYPWKDIVELVGKNKTVVVSHVKTLLSFPLFLTVASEAILTSAPLLLHTRTLHRHFIVDYNYMFY